MKLTYSRGDQAFFNDARARVRDYFHSNSIDRHGGKEVLIKTLFMGLLYLIPFVLIITGTISSVGGTLLCWVMMGLGMSGLGLVTMHDANHGSFSRYHWVNRLFGSSLYMLGGFPVCWKYQHNTLHHTYTNIEGHDEDIGHGGFLRFSPHKPLKKIHKYQYIYAWFFYGLMTIAWITSKDFKQLFRWRRAGVTLSSRNYGYLFSKLIVSKILYYGIFLALPIMIMPLAWYWVVLGFILMHFTSGLILSAIFQTAHVVPSSEYPLPDDNNELSNNWAVHQLHTTSDFAPNSRIFSWFIGGLNYQVVHHLFPNVSHVHYRNLSRIIKETAAAHKLPYHVNRTFFGAVYQHALMLKALGTTTAGRP